MSKSAVRQKRSSHGSRNSEHIDDVLQHVGRKQFLFLEAHICTIYRVTLLSNESFSEAKALTLVDKYRKKRQAHCDGSLLEDRIGFERTKTTGKVPFRPWVAYKEIMYLYVSQAHPEYFVMCIDSERSHQKYYEIYKCKTQEHTRKVEELLRKAMNNPDKILQDANALRQVSVVENDRVRSLAHFEVQESRDSTGEPVNEHPPHGYTHSSSSPQLVKRAPSPVTVASTKQIHVNAAPKSNYERHHIDDSGDITYISIDPQKGAIVNDSGSIYMYLSRDKGDHKAIDSHNSKPLWADHKESTINASQNRNGLSSSYERGL